MKILALVDTNIPEDEMNEVIQKFNEIYAPLLPEWDIHREDMSELKWEAYRPSSLGIKKSYLRRRVKAIQERYNNRYQHILFWVSHNNYLPAVDNAWGWNLSHFAGVHLHQCRFDTDREHRESRIVNTLGTLVHEVAHSHDAQVYVETGKHIEDVLGVPRGRYDEEFVHGQDEEYEYIGRNEDINAGIIKEELMPLLRESYERVIKISLIKNALKTTRQIISHLTKKDYE